MSIIATSVLSKEECKQVIDYLSIVEEKNLWEEFENNPQWQRRAVEIIDVDDPNVLEVVKKSYRIVRSGMPEGFEASSCRIVVWSVATFAEVHTDDIFQGREYSSVVYLNQGFTGGQTYFPNQKVSVDPKTGLGIIFPGNSEYPHGVTEIASGTRYTITGFWTNDTEHQLYRGWA